MAGNLGNHKTTLPKPRCTEKILHKPRNNMGFDTGRVDASPITVVATVSSIILTFVAIYFYKLNHKETSVLHPEKYRKFQIIEKRPASHNSTIFRFKLPRSTDRLGLPVGQHISVAGTIDGKEVVRSYTPITLDDCVGYFELLIKIYEKGAISRFLNEKSVGDHVHIKGPKGFYNWNPNMVGKLGMVAGGTGISPMYQIIKAIVNNPEDKTHISLIYANVTEDDILLKDDLDRMAKEHPENLKIHYVLDKSPHENWQGGVGYVTAEMMEEHLPSVKQNAHLLVCGPPPMVNAIKKSAVALGFPKARAVSKLGDQVFAF